MNTERRIEVQKALKELISLNSTPLLTYAMKREDGKWDVADRGATITVQDSPPGHAGAGIRDAEEVDRLIARAGQLGAKLGNASASESEIDELGGSLKRLVELRSTPASARVTELLIIES